MCSLREKSLLLFVVGFIVVSSSTNNQYHSTVVAFQPSTTTTTTQQTNHSSKPTFKACPQHHGQPLSSCFSSSNTFHTNILKSSLHALPNNHHHAYTHDKSSSSSSTSSSSSPEGPSFANAVRNGWKPEFGSFSGLKRRHSNGSMVTVRSMADKSGAIMPDGGLSPCIIKVVGVGGGGCNAVSEKNGIIYIVCWWGLIV